MDLVDLLVKWGVAYLGRRGIRNDVRFPYTGEQLADLLNVSSLTASGQTVNQETATRVSAVYACLRLIAGSISSLPCQVYLRDAGNGRQVDGDNPIYPLVHSEPNPLMSAAAFWKTVVLQIHLHGNSYSLIGRNRGGQVSNLLLLDPRQVSPLRKDGRFRYSYSLLNGGTETVDQDDILHFTNLFVDLQTGKGMSTISAAAQAIGLSMATENYRARFFKNGAVPSVVLKYPGKVSPELKDKIIEYWQKKHGGDQAHTPAVVTEGGDVTTLSLNAEDAQIIQTQIFSVEDIARFFGPPAWMIGANDKQTSFGTGIEQQKIGYVTFTQRPILVDIEQEANRKLFRNRNSYLEFNLEGLLRGDSKTRAENYRIARGGNQEPAYMTVNEIRKLENLPPLPGGDELFKPALAAQPAATQEGVTNAA